MGLRRLLATVVVALFALLPTVRTVCDLACVPVAVPTAHCTSHESAPASSEAEQGDACEHEHRGESVLIARAAAAPGAACSPAVCTNLLPTPWAPPATIADLARAVVPSRSPEAFSVPLRI